MYKRQALPSANFYLLLSISFFAGVLLFGWLLTLACSAAMRRVARRHWKKSAVLFVLLLLRGLWGLYNLRRRPSHQPGLVGLLAVLGHLALYGLMLVVPLIGLMRQYGSGRPFAPFGVPLMGPSDPIPWMMAPANAAHGLLAWVLLALIAGHVLMVVVHRFVWRDEIAQRMIGRVTDDSNPPGAGTRA